MHQKQLKPHKKNLRVLASNRLRSVKPWCTSSNPWRSVLSRVVTIITNDGFLRLLVALVSGVTTLISLRREK